MICVTRRDRLLKSFSANLPFFQILARSRVACLAAAHTSPTHRPHTQTETKAENGVYGLTLTANGAVAGVRRGACL